MNFCSTRDPAARYSAAQAVACGLSPEGGRFFPETLPVFSPDRILTLAAMRGPRVMQTVLSALLPGFEGETFQKAVLSAWEAAGNFSLRPVRPGIWSAGLFSGPTGTFHDLPMQIFARLLPDAAKAAGLSKTPAALCAAAGDAGRAALAAFSTENSGLLVFFPEDGASVLTRRQMEALRGKACRALAVQADYDELRVRAEAQYLRQSTPQRPLCWAGPDNWGWLAAQTARYFALYAGLLREDALEGGEPVNLVLPCGGGHQLLAALTAKACGLPVGSILCACSKDSALPRFVQTGGWTPRESADGDPALSPRVAPALEQLLFFFTRDAVSTAKKMALLKQTGALPPDPALTRAMEEAGVRAFGIDIRRQRRAMEDLWQGWGLLAAPQTGLAAAALRQYAAFTGDKTPAVWMATATPFLFPDEVLPAMGLDFEGDDLQRLEAMEIVSGQSVPAFLKALRNGTGGAPAIPPEAVCEIVSELS
ncbi:MAG: hypothetical protein IJT76_01880 [Clostridia bacterium]|nr:hypothetical protein [Clostridia bacterium]